MCGIAGRFNFDRRPVDRAALIAARDTLANRGPDDAGVWVQGHVGLAHRRLSILDLSSRGHQPMFDSARQIAISYNGEIFNFCELRQELASKGHTFISDGDTEVILAAYREWGMDCLSRLNGMFAFGLWDANRQTMFLARDRLGVKPLYYACDSNKLVFASTPRAIVSHADVSRDLSPEALSLYLQMSYVPAPHSIYRGIAKLMPGTWLSVDINGTSRTQAWWTLSANDNATRPCSSSEQQHALDSLDELLQSSVKYRLVSDVPVGAFLSGGIDSALIVAMMCSLGSRPRTFTIGFEDKAYDESAHARAIAQHLDTEHTEIVVTQQDLEMLAQSLPAQYDEPFADVSAIPTMALSRLTRRAVTVALSGDGGDELFCGYPYYSYLRRLEPLRKGLSPFAPLLRACARILPHRHAMGLRGLSQPSAQALFAYMRGPLKSRDYDWLAPGMNIRATEFLDETAALLPPGGKACVPMDLDLKTYLPDDILVKVDRASMAYGLEARTPYLDYRVVEAVRALPDTLRARPGKPLLKALLSRYLPLPLFDRPKHGFTVPIRQWLRAGLHEPLAEAVEHGELVRSGFVNREAARKLLEEHASGRHNHENMLWALLCFEQWHRHEHANATHRI